MPSVMTMTSGISASIASMTAPLAPIGGTKITEVSAPVAAIVSATVPKTGTWASSRSTVWPALRGLVPPTTVVPAASMRRPCLRPSEPVMPWIMIRLSPVRKIAISGSCRGRGRRGGGVRASTGRRQFRGAARGVVHGLGLLDHAKAGLAEDRPACRGVVAVETHHDRPGDLLAALAEHAERRHDAVRHGVAGCDAAEHVDQHAAHVRVRQHYLEAVGHDLGRGSATYIEEVRWPDPAERLAGQGHHVECGHDQPGPVADDAHLPIELDVVEVFRPGPCLNRVRGTRVGEPIVVLPEGRVVVEGDLPVE